MKEYRVCHREHGSEHTSAVKFRDWGGRQNWQGNATDEEREQAAFEWLDEHRRFSRIFYGIKECDMWLEEREVGAWHEVFADGERCPKLAFGQPKRGQSAQFRGRVSFSRARNLHSMPRTASGLPSYSKGIYANS